MNTFTNAYSNYISGLIALLSLIFGQYWFLFVLFLILNVVDWITGWMKSRMLKKENSAKGWTGVLKKIGYWLMILVSFAFSAGFVEIGKALGFDLGITQLLGYFVLASLIINEGRSICENFVEAGFNVPKVLSNGLAVADKLINKEESED